MQLEAIYRKPGDTDAPATRHTFEASTYDEAKQRADNACPEGQIVLSYRSL